MTIDSAALSDQMNRSRYRNGRFERLEGGEWVPWPVLPLDKAGVEEAKREALQGRPRPANRVP